MAFNKLKGEKVASRAFCSSFFVAAKSLEISIDFFENKY